MTSRQYKRALLVLAVSGLVALMALAVMLDLHWNSGQGLGSIVVLGITALVVVWYTSETRRLAVSTKDMADETGRLALSTKAMADAATFSNVVIRVEERVDETQWRREQIAVMLQELCRRQVEWNKIPEPERSQRLLEESARARTGETPSQPEKPPREKYMRRVSVIANHGPGPALDVCVDTSDGGMEEVARVLLPQVVVQLPGTDSRREATLRYRDVSGCEYTHKWRYDDSLADWCPV